MKFKITRRTLCGWLAATPVAAAVGSLALSSGSAAATAKVAATPTTEVDYIGRTLKVVSSDSGISIDTILSPIRTREVVAVRQKALYLANSLSGKPVNEIGRRFGGRDHTTVIHAVRKMRARRDSDEAFRQDLFRLARLISPHGAILVAWEHGLRKGCGAEPIPS
jgi:chromosomal replication initiation ATPase DnaA